MPATDDFRWNQKTLHAVFAASSVFMLLSVYAMLRQDQGVEPGAEGERLAGLALHVDGLPPHPEAAIGDRAAGVAAQRVADAVLSGSMPG